MGVDVVVVVGTGGGVVGAREACCCWVGFGHPVCNMSVSADFPQPSLLSFELVVVVVEEEDLFDLEEDVDLADLEVVASTLLLLLLLELSLFLSLPLLLSLPPPPLCQPGNCRNNFRPPPPAILLLLPSLLIFI